MLSKEFAGGILIMTGANSAVGLRSTRARYIFLDGVDAYPASADEEGDPVSLAEARTLTFAHRRKVFLASTPTIRGLSRIEREYEASDQRRYFVACPHCGIPQWLKFERLPWEKGKPETVAYVCESCDAAIAEHHKTAMRDGGEWRATAASADPATIGFHLSALYSPLGWLSWERIARAWEARRTGSGSMIAGNAGRPARARSGRPARARYGAEGRAVPNHGRRRAEGPHRNRCLGLGPGVGELARRSCRHRWRPRAYTQLGRAGGAVEPDVDPCARGAAGDRSARRRHRLRGAGGLRLGTAARVCAGGADQGRGGLQSGEPGVRPDLCRRHRRRQTDQARYPALDRRCLDLQGRSIPVSAAGPADDGGARSRRIVPAGNGASARLGRERMAEAIRRRATGDGEDEARFHPTGMAEAARAQRGAGVPRLRPGRLDGRRRAAPPDRWSEARWADLEAQLGAGDDDGAGSPTAAGSVRPVQQVQRRRSLGSSYMR